MSVLVLALMQPSAAACGLEALEAGLGEAERSLEALDPEGFETAMEGIGGLLECLREPIAPSLAARLHRAVGIRAFASRGPIAAGAFAAARRIEPVPPMNALLLQPDAPVSEAWVALSLDGLRTRTLPAPSTGAVVLDGTPSLERAIDLPVVFQRLEPDGSVSLSTYLLPGETTPSYPTGKTRVARSGPRAPYAVAAVVSGAAAAGLWGLSAEGRGRYFDLEDPVPDERLNGLQTRTNALTAGSVLSAGVCAVSSALLVLTW